MLRLSTIKLLNRFHHSLAESEPVSILLRKHSESKSIKHCKQIHAKLILSNAISELYVANTLLNLYPKCGDLHSAHLLFDQMPQRNTVSWTSLVSSYVHHGSSKIALKLFREMLSSDQRPNQYTFSIAIRACMRVGFSELGLQIHGLNVRVGYERDEFSGSSLVDFYFKIVCSFEDAFRVFDGLFRKDSVTWNVMISGFSEVGDTTKVLELFYEMRVGDGLKPNDFTFTSLLKCCRLIREVEQIHGLALKFGAEDDIVVGSSLVDLYGKCGNIDSSWKILNSMQVKDSYVWSSIISGYARNERGHEAINLFIDMCRQGVKPDQHALSSSLKGCVEIQDFRSGIQIHTQMIKNGFQSDCFVASVLLIVYSNANQFCEAKKLFRRIDNKDLVAWNSMITGLAEKEDGSASSCINVFRELCQTTMLKPDGATLNALLKSCKSSSDLVTGNQVHAMIIKSKQSCETPILNAVINMYSKCGAIDDAYRAFDDIENKDEISWSSIIGSYQQNGFELEALGLCREMLENGVPFTIFSLPSCIAACSELAGIEIGKQFHSFIVKLGFDKGVFINSSIIDMYAKCGNLEDSRKAFEEQHEPNEVTFNTLICGFAQHGKANEAIGLFENMEKMKFVPNKITFLAVLSACAHMGLLEKSVYFFNLMDKKYDITPEAEHFSCLVDVFGRAGKLEEAYEIIQNDGSVSAWRTLLSACRNYGNAKIAEKCVRHIMKVDRSEHASYVLLSNLYSGEGKWEEALKLRREMVDYGVKKDRAASWLIP